MVCKSSKVGTTTSPPTTKEEVMQQTKKRKPQPRVPLRGIGSVPPVTPEQTAAITIHEATIAKARTRITETGASEVFIGVIAVILHVTEDMGGGVLSAEDGSPMAWTVGIFDTFDEAFAKAHIPFGTGTAVATVTADTVTITVV
jgi:hypothetical protein